MDFCAECGILTDGAVRGVRAGDLRYVRIVRNGKERLYDLGKDPNERKDVSGDPAYDAKLEERRKRHQKGLTETGR